VGTTVKQSEGTTGIKQTIEIPSLKSLIPKETIGQNIQMPRVALSPATLPLPPSGNNILIKGKTASPQVQKIRSPAIKLEEPPKIIEDESGIPKIEFPTFNTLISINKREMQAKVSSPAQMRKLLREEPIVDPIMKVLNEIDPDRLIAERAGRHKKVYMLDELQNFARNLGIAVSGKRKQTLIDEIQNIRRNRGIIT
jgi:hypothetical protein